MIEVVGFDADDTLWHDARDFAAADAEVRAIVANQVDPDAFAAALARANVGNLSVYGYGVKGYVLSAVEALVTSAERNDVSTDLLRRILVIGKTLLAREVEVIDGVADALAKLRGKVELVLITKGDLRHQESKLGDSGLAVHFDRVEVLSDKTPASYQRIFGYPRDDEPHAAMIGNSMRSDILPAIAAGAWGLHVPHLVTWSHETSDLPDDRSLYRSFENIGDAGEWVLARLR